MTIIYSYCAYDTFIPLLYEIISYITLTLVNILCTFYFLTQFWISQSLIYKYYTITLQGNALTNLYAEHAYILVYVCNPLPITFYLLPFFLNPFINCICLDIEIVHYPFCLAIFHLIINYLIHKGLDI